MEALWSHIPELFFLGSAGTHSNPEVKSGDGEGKKGGEARICRPSRLRAKACRIARALE